jgi:hypothetical protein
MRILRLRRRAALLPPQVKAARPQKRRPGSKPVFQRWAEARLYRKTMQIAVAELRRAARTANALEKLESLDIAEQKLLDAQWLNPDQDKPRFEAGLGEIARSRAQTLEQAITAVERLLDGAEEGRAERSEMVAAAGQILSYLNHYLPENLRVDALNARLLRLGGAQPAYTPVTPLSEMYARPDAATGCGAAIGLFLFGMMLAVALAKLVQ